MVTPGPEVIEYPTLLENPAPQLIAYPRYTLVAEKFETLVFRGLANSRLKDFFDLWLVSRLFEFDGEILKQSIINTFSRRGMPLPKHLPVALTAEFYEDTQKKAQWKAFAKNSKIAQSSADFGLVIAGVIEFLGPIIDALAQEKSAPQIWRPHEKWA